MARRRALAPGAMAVLTGAAISGAVGTADTLALLARLAGVQPAAAAGGWIDTHTHLVATGGRNGCDFEAAGAATVSAMDRIGVQRCLLMRQPDPETACETTLGALARRFPDRFAYMAGGGTLNPMIEATRSGGVDGATRALFEETAAQLIADGATGFGETAVTHLSFSARHPFEEVPADHPLFLVLADVAARLNVPIDVHMDTVPADMPTSGVQHPALSSGTPTQNPAALRENVSGFERLLDYNPDARIVWAHAGGDGTQFRTPDLIRRLLAAHANLFVQVAVRPGATGVFGSADSQGSQTQQTAPQAPAQPQIPGRPQRPQQPQPPQAPQRPGVPGVSSGPGALGADATTGLRVTAEWLALLTDFPDRFVLGTDWFYQASGDHLFQSAIDSGSAAARQEQQQQELFERVYALFLNQLPAKLAGQIGSENATRIYRLA